MMEPILQGQPVRRSKYRFNRSRCLPGFGPIPFELMAPADGSGGAAVAWSLPSSRGGGQNPLQPAEVPARIGRPLVGGYCRPSLQFVTSKRRLLIEGWFRHCHPRHGEIKSDFWFNRACTSLRHCRQGHNSSNIFYSNRSIR